MFRNSENGKGNNEPQPEPVVEEPVVEEPVADEPVVEEPKDNGKGNDKPKNDNNGGELNLWQQIQAQKQQEAQMMQLRQLMAMNLQRQQKRKSGAKNFRASAA